MANTLLSMKQMFKEAAATVIDLRGDFGGFFCFLNNTKLLESKGYRTDCNLQR